MCHPPAVPEQQQDDDRADPVQGLRRPPPPRSRIEHHDGPIPHVGTILIAWGHRATARREARSQARPVSGHKAAAWWASVSWIIKAEGRGHYYSAARC